LIGFYFQSDSRVPSVEQNITELPKLTKAPSPISDSTSTVNMQNANRRELPNVPKPTTPNENRPSTSQNPFYNPPTTTNASTSRPSPSQWMGNISQTIRRQTTNAADVKKNIEFLRIRIMFLFIFRVAKVETRTNLKIH